MPGIVIIISVIPNPPTQENISTICGTRYATKAVDNSRQKVVRKCLPVLTGVTICKILYTNFLVYSPSVGTQTISLSE